MKKVSIIGDDLAKNVFQLHGAAPNGAVLFHEAGRGSGYCEVLDADGDRLIIPWTATEPDRGEWRFVGGTGKFKGIAGEGTYQAVDEFPSFAQHEQLSCIETTGTYRLER